MITFAIVIASDRSFRKEREDLCGPLLHSLITSNGWEVASTCVLPDDQDAIAQELKRLADQSECHVVVTSGGTGLTERDLTPEATRRVIDKEIPGIAEFLRAESMKFTLCAALSRGVAGICKKTLIINLPGNPESIKQLFPLLAPILEHAVGLLRSEEKHIHHITE